MKNKQNVNSLFIKTALTILSTSFVYLFILLVFLSSNLEYHFGPLIGIGAIATSLILAFLSQLKLFFYLFQSKYSFQSDENKVVELYSNIQNELHKQSTWMHSCFIILAIGLTAILLTYLHSNPLLLIVSGFVLTAILVICWNESKRRVIKIDSK